MLGILADVVGDVVASAGADLLVGGGRWVRRKLSKEPAGESRRYQEVICQLRLVDVAGVGRWRMGILKGDRLYLGFEASGWTRPKRVELTNAILVSTCRAQHAGRRRGARATVLVLQTESGRFELSADRLARLERMRSLIAARSTQRAQLLGVLGASTDPVVRAVQSDL